MDEESGGLHTIFICILAGILVLSYSAIPTHTADTEIPKETSRISSKNQTKADTPVGKEETATEETVSEQKEDQMTSAENTVSETESAEQPVSLVSDKNDAAPSGFTAVISMNNPAYDTHKKSIVEFTHLKHVEDYKITCGQCHHDEEGKPLDLTYGDSVQGCIECHPETQKEKGEKLDDRQKIAKYHFEAVHANCINCHKTYNVEKGDPKGKGPAPISCTQCHPKE